jgi:tRNA pseudouridine38/39 synthase
MVGILFLVGQGLEEPGVIDELLNIEANPCKPRYEMADDAPLVLWDCVFSEEEDEDGSDTLRWVYAGDAVSVPSLSAKNDGKFGLGAVADVLWDQWRRSKTEELLTGSLLDLVISQGDSTAMTRGGFRNPARASRSQKIFYGGDNARLGGSYVPILQKPRNSSLEEQNERYVAGRKFRREETGAVDGGGDD